MGVSVQDCRNGSRSQEKVGLFLYESLYCIPTTVSSVLNCARIPAAERLDDPLPTWAFSSTVTRNPRSASRTAESALVAPPPMITTWSPDEDTAIDLFLLPYEYTETVRALL